MIKKLKAYWGGKSVKQRVYICIALTALLTLLFFTVKANFFDKPNVPQTASESAETEEYELPAFHISLIDAGILLAVIGAYSVHKIREKKKQGRL
ncbi:MAG: hypothetical protein NC299_18225 [Lachnospiraceae bacterium]|nr:hypothetical protein [Lachnospiraceae bacterium]MCM1277266.1 hypothetical protein [Lachnospiraceae bacterium]